MPGTQPRSVLRGTGVPYFTPAQLPAVGTAIDPTAEVPTLFAPLQLRSLTLVNRFAVAPMCMDSCEDGLMTDFHLVHLGAYALRGAALTIFEATAVTANGRITTGDAGLWHDGQIPPVKRIVDFIHSQGQKAGIQLAHAGRKASNLPGWDPLRARGVNETAEESDGGWPEDVWAPSAIPFSASYPKPKALFVEQIQGLVQSFQDAAVRAVKAGFDTIEIHAAHGYLLSEFLSPITNVSATPPFLCLGSEREIDNPQRRTDAYGGSFENRTRFLIEVINAVRAVIPIDMPLLVRISATEWMEHTGQESWDISQSLRLAQLLPDLGVDLLDVSSGGNNNEQKIALHPYYQVDIAGRIRDALRAEGKSMLIGAVGLITTAEMAKSVVQEDGTLTGEKSETVEVDAGNGQKAKADLVLAARQFLREPEFVLRTAYALGVKVKWPVQYGRAPFS